MPSLQADSPTCPPEDGVLQVAANLWQETVVVEACLVQAGVMKACLVQAFIVNTRLVQAGIVNACLMQAIIMNTCLVQVGIMNTRLVYACKTFHLIRSKALSPPQRVSIPLIKA